MGRFRTYSSSSKRHPSTQPIQRRKQKDRQALQRSVPLPLEQQGAPQSSSQSSSARSPLEQGESLLQQTLQRRGETALSDPSGSSDLSTLTSPHVGIQAKLTMGHTMRQPNDAIAHKLIHTGQKGATLQRQPEGSIQRKLVRASDNTQMVTIEEAIKFVETQLNITEAKDRDTIRTLAEEYAQDNSLTTPSQLMVIAKGTINASGTSHPVNASASDSTASDKATESTVDPQNIDVDSSSSLTSEEHAQVTDTQTNNGAANSVQDSATDEVKNDDSPQDPQIIKPVTTLPTLNTYKKVRHRYFNGIGNILCSLEDVGGAVLEKVRKLEPSKASKINKENDLEPIYDAGEAVEEQFVAEIMPILQEEEGKPGSKRRSYTEILEPIRIECQRLFDRMIEVFENSNIALNKYWPQDQRPGIWTAVGFLTEVERNLDEEFYESPQVPENMSHALQHMKQSVGEGACNLAASIASLIMSESQSLRENLNSCFLGEDENGVLSYRFHGQNNAISQYKGKGADSSHNQTINEILNISKKIYTVKRADLIQGDLLTFSQPWITYLAQAYYECEKDYGLHTQDVGEDSYELDIAIEIKENKESERKIIYYNWIMNRIGQKFYSYKDETPNKNGEYLKRHPNIPDNDDDCKGKMFKLSEDSKHATAVVCTWNGERRYYDNERINENTGYEDIGDIPAKPTIKQFIEETLPPSPYVFIYEIPEALSSESE